MWRCSDEINHNQLGLRHLYVCNQAQSVQFTVREDLIGHIHHLRSNWRWGHGLPTSAYLAQRDRRCSKSLLQMRAPQSFTYIRVNPRSRKSARPTGHPFGASGARVLNTLVFEMKRLGVSKGVATLCMGGRMRWHVRRSDVKTHGAALGIKPLDIPDQTNLMSLINGSTAEVLRTRPTPARRGSS
ncbi:hypothetical protein ACVMB2_003423 [Sinorhizobium meliloti]